MNPTINEGVLSSGLNITSFGLDQENELLICANSKIFKLISDENPMILGDLNQDSMINVQDVILLINIILGQTPNDQQMWAGDMNSDETIDILDVVLLVNRILS